MPDSTPGATPKVTSPSSARTRPTGRSRPPRPTPAPSPTRSLEPGHVHYRIAAGVLKGLQARARENGVELDVGQVPNLNGDTDGVQDDPERLTRIVARIVARGGDRIRIFRKLSRHLEGEDKRSGLLSDAVAALVELYQRNPDTFHELGKQTAQNFNAKRMSRAATKETNNPGGIANATR